MKTYDITITYTAYANLTVEAEDRDQAENAAWQQWDGETYDGSTDITEIEEVIEPPKVRASELRGTALDLAVAKCEGLELTKYDDYYFLNNYRYSPSTDWALGGPIIERERIELTDLGGDTWRASSGFKTVLAVTTLEAAMRAFVASKLGDEFVLN